MEDHITQFFDPKGDLSADVSETMKSVFKSMQDKGYDPVNQMVGYIMSDDPTYITSYQNARTKLSRFSRDEILEELLQTFIRANQLDEKEKQN